MPASEHPTPADGVSFTVHVDPDELAAGRFTVPPLVVSPGDPVDPPVPTLPATPPVRSRPEQGRPGTHGRRDHGRGAGGRGGGAAQPRKYAFRRS